MKNKLILSLSLLLITCFSYSNPRFRKGQWVYWEEVNFSGQKIVAVGKVISKDMGQGTYRVLADEGWKMHLSGAKLSLIPKKKK